MTSMLSAKVISWSGLITRTPTPFSARCRPTRSAMAAYRRFLASSNQATSPSSTGRLAWTTDMQRCKSSVSLRHSRSSVGSSAAPASIIRVRWGYPCGLPCSSTSAASGPSPADPSWKRCWTPPRPVSSFFTCASVSAQYSLIISCSSGSSRVAVTKGIISNLRFPANSAYEAFPMFPSAMRLTLAQGQLTRDTPIQNAS